MIGYHGKLAFWIVVFCGTHLLLWTGVGTSAHSQVAVAVAQKTDAHEKLLSPDGRQEPSPGSSSKEVGEGVWVVAEAIVQFADDMTVQEAQSRSRNEARRKAVEKAAGIFVKGKTVVLSASAGDQVSNTYSAKGHGLLTYFFLKGLRGEADKNQDKVIDAQELFAYVKPSVEWIARREYNNEQTPQLIGETSFFKRLNLVGQSMP
jgi:hypothetical protein